MMTWFDAVLVTSLALMTALGARRGLMGLLWSLGAVVVCFVSNLLSGLPALVAALVLSVGLSLGLQQLTRQRLFPVGRAIPWWQTLLGGLGGLGFGAVLICTVALAFPLSAHGHTYPAQANLPKQFYQALKNSYIQRQLQRVWVAGQATKTLLVPDQTHR